MVSSVEFDIMMINSKILKRLYPLFIIFAAVIFLYHPVLTTYFSQDDFFHFKVSQTDDTLLGFLKLFGFYKFEERGIAFYRPISREIPFNIFYHLFGLNALPFRILSLGIHFINIILVYLLLNKVFQRRKLSFLVAFFFGITAANVASLYYLAGGIQTLMATTFSLSSLLFYNKYLKTDLPKFKIFAFLSFLLAIGSHEQAIITPFLIFGLILIDGGIRALKKYSLDVVFLFLITFALIFLEIFKIGFSSKEQQYQAIFSLKTIFNSLFWYMGWALGLPETLIDFVQPGFKLNPNLLKYWGNYYIFIFPSFLLSVLLIIISLIYLFIKSRRIFRDKIFLFNLIWFPLGLMPVILLPLHKSTHYLAISLVGFWSVTFLIILNFYQKIRNKSISFANFFLAVFILSLIILSSTSAILGSTNYWAATRGKLAKHIVDNLQNSYPDLPKGAIIYFKNDTSYPFLTKEWGGSSKQASLILNGSDALRLLYHDPTLQVFYQDLTIPKDFPKDKIYTIIAKVF